MSLTLIGPAYSFRISLFCFKVHVMPWHSPTTSTFQTYATSTVFPSVSVKTLKDSGQVKTKTAKHGQAHDTPRVESSVGQQ